MVISLFQYLIVSSLVLLLLGYSLQLYTFGFFILSSPILVVNNSIIFYFTHFSQLLDLSKKPLFSIEPPILTVHADLFAPSLACVHY